MPPFKLQRIVIIFCWSILAVGGQYPDWLHQPHVTSPPPIHIMQPAGKEIQLPCWNKSKSNLSSQENFKSHDVVWHYKRCGLGYHLTSCQSSSSVSWTAICGNRTNPCSATLVINITSEGSSGLYRCSVSHRNKTSRNFKVTQTYEVEIIEMKGSPPEFLEDQPSNVTVHTGESAVFQCRVHSKVPPKFFWLRRQDEDTSSNGEITYLNNTYERLRSSGERDLSNEVYLSKLILPRSSQQDNGYYICVAISDGGFQYKGAYLTILTNTPLERNASDSVSSSSLPLLFLIPAALALVPVMVWVCCQWKKRCRRNHLSAHSRQDPIIIIESVHHNNNPVSKLRGYTPVSSSGYCSLNECKRHCHHCKHHA
ncbi:fibroblast growth factor receptor-like 1 [Periplaneta americana]|uniref:fibroblast growth factor receptor-like 1 n=1 Tax=Periplaneta americana TaxID=6978 RepID=UPI0037E81A17